MQSITDFTTATALPPAPDSLCSLYLRGQKLGISLPGTGLVAQYQAGDQFLLVSDYDYFDGVTNWFTLLAPDGIVLDVVSPPDVAGGIDKLELVGHRQLHFGFYHSPERWQLTLLPKPLWRFSQQYLWCRSSPFMLSRRWLHLSQI
ncbi:MAG: hypothetical protein PHH58_05085 [Rhodoferax sp.]|nr:hypothetical protein [Rhodoferax sp.]